MGPRPLRKHHRLGVGLGEQVLEQRRQFVGLDPMIGLMVQQIGAVARHAHVLQRAGHSPLVLVRQEPGLAPALDDPRDDVGVFLVIEHLHLGHRHQQVLVGPAGQLPQHLGFAPADHDRRQRLADLLQPGIAGDAPGFVLDLMLVQQLPGRPQPVLIDELDDGNQLFQLVLQGCPGQHDRVGAVDALQGARRDGVPVLHPLRLVDDHQFGRPGGDQVEIRLEFLVVRDLAEIIQGESRFCRCARPPLMTRAALSPCRPENRMISLCHWYFSDVGQTTSTFATPKCCARISVAAIAWMVLPRPISSPISARPARTANSAPSA